MSFDKNFKQHVHYYITFSFYGNNKLKFKIILEKIYYKAYKVSSPCSNSCFLKTFWVSYYSAQQTLHNVHQHYCPPILLAIVLSSWFILAWLFSVERYPVLCLHESLGPFQCWRPVHKWWHLYITFVVLDLLDSYRVFYSHFLLSVFCPSLEGKLLFSSVEFYQT